MEKVVNFVKQDEQDWQYIQYWLQQPIPERLKEVTRLRYNYYTWLNKSFPDKIEKLLLSGYYDLAIIDIIKII